LVDYLDILAQDVKRAVADGYYNTRRLSVSSFRSLREAIEGCRKTPIVSEIKLASPSSHSIREGLQVGEAASAMERGGAVGISVITEPKHFKGSLKFLIEARRRTRLPVLMKDIIMSPAQIETASSIGADAILLIQALFDRGYSESGLLDMIDLAHSRKVEVLLETHTNEEFQTALRTDADMIGINNRDLSTLTVDIHVTERILKLNDPGKHIVVSESGIEKQRDVQFLKRCGAKAFLIGSALMSASNIEEKVREFVEA